ncbi:MAG: family 78 glycoside hydrolase catalytic domain, partial [Planctomycetota bacterium]
MSRCSRLLPVMAMSLAAGLVSVGDARAAASVTRLRCEYAVDPVGIGESKPRLSWVMTSDARGDVQTGYQIIVASSERVLARDRGDLWDSRKVDSDRSAHVEYGGTPLGSRRRSWWKVRVWDSRGRRTGWSAPAVFETGLLRAADWKAEWIGSLFDDGGATDLKGAKWIWFPEGNPAKEAPAGDRFFRRSFDLPAGARVESAKIVVTVDDRFVLYVNGKEVAKSGGTDAWRKPVKVDLRDRLARGSNLLAVAATNTGAPAGFIGKLVVKIGGRKPLVVPTDKLWKVSRDRRGGWEAPGFDDSEWRAAMQVADFGKGPWGKVGASGTGRVPPFMRKGFSLPKPVRSARVYASALGIYELLLNGKRVGDYVFAPGWTDYRKRVHYQTYDVTDLLRRGENALGAIIGDGWYAGHVGLGGPNRYGDFPVLIYQLEVEYEDGSRETISTDATWKASPGPLLTGDMLMGETHDARKEMPGWAEPGFDDAAWQAVTAREVSVPLEAERGPAVRKLIELDARKVAEPTPGAYVFDMGQNMVGWARIAVRAPEGTTVQLRFAEMLNPDGTIYTRNLRGAKNIDRYVCRGEGLEVWEPRFTFHGFRYVEMTGLPRRPALDAVKGVVVYSDTPTTGTFECSSKMLNQLQQNIIWGQRGNYLSVPTDCPQRDERLGWTGDAQVFVRTA